MQALRARPDAAGLLGYQAGENVFDGVGVLGKPLQFVLGVKHSRPSVVGGPRGVLAGTLQRHRGRARQKAVFTASQHLSLEGGVRWQRGAYMYAKTVQQSALAGHAAADDAGEVRAQIEPRLLAAVFRAEERCSAGDADGFEPRAFADGDVRRIVDLDQFARRTTVGGTNP